MRRSISLCFLALGCVQPAPGVVYVPAAPPTAATPPVKAPPAATPVERGMCAYSEAIEPALPAEPTQACLREKLSADGAVIEHLQRHVTVDGPVTTTQEELFDKDGPLTTRTTHRESAGLLVFESLETLSLAPTATLPYTYGQPATYSVTYEHNPAGKVTRQSTDLAMDGMIDDEQRWTFNDAGVLTRHETIESGETIWTETWRDDGQPLTRLDSSDYGQRWTYDSGGLMTREETLSQGKVTEYTAWKMKARDVPLASRHVVVGKIEEIQGEETWTYDAAGRLDVMQGWGRVYSFDRKNRTDYDDLGRETRYEEDTEEPSCHAYIRVSLYVGDALVDQNTTCDGGAFEHLWTTLDTKGRPIHYEHTFDGNPLSPSHETDDSTYDECGAVTFHQHTWDGKVTAKDTLTLDTLGRVIARKSSYGGAPEGTALYLYDADGHVLSMDGKTFTWDASGRLTRIDDKSGEAERFTFACSE